MFFLHNYFQSFTEGRFIFSVMLVEKFAFLKYHNLRNHVIKTIDSSCNNDYLYYFQ
ncbi:hypothetical protein CLV98_1263 [Dyadobacter jejuensis]|uniref:Uncharacterized protein n=1 Tax=Dyadobacter jejuensis TaxID=1082580 RepID=A0A316A8E2_9BACT|nr:hypothetical protein CLV98_1263 [Dyadobacter jejuensis]